VVRAKQHWDNWRENTIIVLKKQTKTKKYNSNNNKAKPLPL
jgi:hypothetical protein